MSEARFGEAKEAGTIFDGAMKAVSINWSEIGEWIRKMVAEYGIEYIDDIAAIAKSAVAAFVAIDLPLLPNFVEGWLDALTKRILYGVIDRVVEELTTL